jgi:hypothetical protein
VYATLGTVLVVAVGDSGATLRSVDLGASWQRAAAKTSASLAHVHVVDEMVRGSAGVEGVERWRTDICPQRKEARPRLAFGIRLISTF